MFKPDQYAVIIIYSSGLQELRKGFPTEEAALLHVRRVELYGLEASIIKLSAMFDVEEEV